jgi:hypothetical protein
MVSPLFVYFLALTSATAVWEAPAISACSTASSSQISKLLTRELHLVDLPIEVMSMVNIFPTPIEQQCVTAADKLIHMV